MKVKNILWISLTALLLSCNSETKKVAEIEHAPLDIAEDQVNAMGILTRKPEVKDFSQPVFVRGKIVLPVHDEQMISSSIPGRINRIFVSSGDNVGKGDPLIQISGMEIISLQENYLISKVQLLKLEKDMERKKLLVGEKVVSDKDFEFVKAEYERELIQKKALELKLKLLNIDPAKVTMENMASAVVMYSPADGIVNDILVSTGAGIEAEQDLMMIANTDAPLLELYVPETEVSLVEVGQSVDWDIVSANTQDLSARVIRISSVVEQSSRSFRVIAKPESHPDKILPGMFVSARIQSGEKNGIALPETSLFYNENREPYVFISQQDGTGFKVMNVEPGAATNGYFEVLNADSLFLQYDVVVSGGYYLKSVLLMEE
jgi:cobalt-zinc-cadmium efflux system membrane fusion protein